MEKQDKVELANRKAKPALPSLETDWTAKLAANPVSIRAFPVKQLDMTCVMQLIDAAAVASAFIGFGFNRSGVMNMTISIAGKSRVVPITELNTAENTLAILEEIFITHAVDNGWYKPTG